MKLKKIKSIAAVILLGSLLSAGLIAQENKFEVWVPYTVTSGDTLWSIALNSSMENESTLVTLDKIKTYNNLDSKTIYPGDEILIPSELISDLSSDK